MQSSTKNFLMGMLFLIIIGVLTTQSYFLYDIKQEFNNEMILLGDSLVVLDNKLDSQKRNLEEDLNDLRGETTNAIQSLGGN